MSSNRLAANCKISVEEKICVQPFRKREGGFVKKLFFEGFAWPSKRTLTVLTEKLESGKYTLEIREKSTNQTMKQQNFTIK